MSGRLAVLISGRGSNLRAIAGATVPLVNADFEPDAAAAAVEQGLSIKDVSKKALKKFFGHQYEEIPQLD